MIKKRPGGKVYWLDIWCGKKRYRRSLHTDERALAFERARDVERELRTPKKPGTDLLEFSAKYFEYARTAKPASYMLERQRWDIIKRWIDTSGISTLDELTPYHVEQLRAWLRQRMRKKGDKTYDAGRSRATINRYCQLLRGIFYKAIEWDLYHGQNPLRRVKFYRETEKVRPLTEAEIGKVLDAARGMAVDGSSKVSRLLFDLCVLVLNTGLRRSEALNIKWSDIRDEGLRVCGKGGKIRVVPLNAEAWAVIERQARMMPYVFDIPNRNSASVLRRATETLKRRTGVPFHLHLLRHAMASRLLAAGVDIVTIGELLGHSAAMVTMLYAHSNPARKREAVDTLMGHRQKDVSA